jgi:hypothetical protein
MQRCIPRLPATLQHDAATRRVLQLASGCLHGFEWAKIYLTFSLKGYCKYLLALYTDPVKQAKETPK